jgi:type I restriction enzyme S subunit
MATLKPYKKYNPVAYDYAKQLPDGWQLLPNIAVFQERIERGYENEELLSVTIGRGVIKQSELDKKDSSTLDKSKYLLVHPDDLVYSMRFRQGASGYSNYKGIVSPACTVLKPRKGIKLNSRYYYYMFRTGFYKNYAERYAYGIADGQMPLRYTDFKRMYSIVPPLEVQNRIVEYLDKKNNEIEKFIRNKERLIEILEEQKVNVVNEHIKGFHTEKNFIDTENEFIGKIPSGWSFKRLKHVATVKGRIGFRGYTVQDIVGFGEGAITLSPSNVLNHKLILEENTYLSWKKYYESPEIMIYENDIVFVKTGSTIGKTALMPKTDEKMTLNPQLVVFKKIRINPEFLYFLFTTSYIQKIIELDIIGGAAGTLSQQKTKTIPVFFPDDKKQQLIVSMIKEEYSKIDFAINNARKEISSIKEYREALITDLVTGKRCIPQLQAS